MTDYTASRGAAWQGTTSAANSNGVVISIVAMDSVKLARVVKSSTCTAAKCTLYTAGYVLLETAAFVGDTAYFITRNSYLDANTNYRIELHADGASYTLHYTSTPNYPYEATPSGFAMSGGSLSGVTNNDNHWNIESITIKDIDGQIIVGTASSGEKEIKTSWPVTEGLTAGTTKQIGKKIRLEPEEGSLLRKSQTIGLS